MKFFETSRVSLRITLFYAFLGTVIFTTLLNAGISSLHVRNLIKNTIREKLSVAVGIGAKQINGDLHAKIVAPEDNQRQEYKTIFSQLEAIRKINPDIKNVYTIRESSKDGAVFVVDSDPKIKERAKIGHKVILITPAIKEAFDTKNKIVVENNYFTDEWGTFVSGFAPIYTSAGTFEGLLGIDIMAETVKTHQLNNILAIITTSLLVTIVAVFLSLIVSRKISRPISQVTADMGEIQKFNLDTDFKSTSVIHEIREMTDALESMKIGLRSFQKYVPTALVSDLIKLKKEASLEVENRKISILFTDIRGFTTIAEQISPEKLAESIGIYFGDMTQAVMDNGGIVDKYIGDAIMALWGAPHDFPDHPLAACRTALACRKKEVKINKILSEKGIPTFFTRMGINTGEALVGNIGYDKRMSYTAVGDSVNLAARLESINKLYHTGILISESTYESVKEVMAARFIDVVIVKGKTCGVRIYELLSEIEFTENNVLEQVNRHNEAMELYMAKQWESALKIFKDLLDQEESSYAAKMMVERCEGFIQNPPGDDFVGVVALRTK